MRQIETVEDIKKLLGWIKDNTQKSNSGFYGNVLLRLYAEGEFEAVHVDSLVRMVSNKRLWSDQANAEPDTPLSILRDRFARRIRWINNDVLGRKGSPYINTVAIIYDRSSSRYQMVTDPERLKAFRSRNGARSVPDVDVDIQTEDIYQALPELPPNGELEFGIRASIEGYVHIFHRDAHGHIDKLFPEAGSEQFFHIGRGKEVFFPDAVSDLCQLKCWRIGALDSGEPEKQHLLVMVTARNAEVSLEDAIVLFGEVTARPIYIEHLTVEDLSARQKLSSVAAYWLKG